MSTARRFVLVDDFMPIRTRAPLVLQPNAVPARTLARHVCALVAETTPRFTFNRVRAVLRSLI